MRAFVSVKESTLNAYTYIYECVCVCDVFLDSEFRDNVMPTPL